MKNLLILIGIFALVFGTPALAAEKLLTDRQLDGITAGTGEVVVLQADNVQQTLTGNQVDPQINNPNVQNQVDNQNAQALNIVTTPTVNVDNSVEVSQNVNSKNDVLVLQDFAQENAKAVNIVNNIWGQVANGVNAHANVLRPDLVSAGSSSGTLNNLYQTNIINLNHN
jgi:hypothetical protein